MIRRRLIFGGVFLTAGVLVLLAASVYLDQQIRFVDETTQDGRTQWYLDTELADFAECAGCASLVSITVAIKFFAGAAISATWRRHLGD
jgi:hypothetical protein